MKPKDLKAPFSWSERRPFIQDKVFYVPDYYFEYEKFAFPSWSDRNIFCNRAPVHLEYCSGNGDWIIAKAKSERDKNWVAVEKRFDRVRKIWSKLKNDNVENLFIICGKGEIFSRYYVPAGSVDGVYVNFPDPWPKDRHAKHRIIQEKFLEDLSRITKEGAEVSLVTDDCVYSIQMVKKFLENKNFESCYREPYYLKDLPDYGRSWFDNLWRAMKREIRYIKFFRNGNSYESPL